MRILVTGGAGFIGSHLCAHLVSKGHDVLIYDHGSANAPTWLKVARGRYCNAEIIAGDILDTANLAQVIREFDTDTLIHLAAKPGVAEAEEDFRLYQRVNVHGVESVLEACASAALGHIIYASSSSVYGDAVGQVNEARSPSPIGKYGQTKLEGEEKIRQASKLRGIHARILRPFTVIGPMGRPDMAPWKFAEAISKDAKVNLHAGAMRDFTSVYDVVSAFALAAELPWEGCETYNIGSGVCYGADVLAKLLAEAMGKTLHHEVGPLPTFMPKKTWSDSSGAMSRLGWRPKVAFPDAVRDFASWYQSNNQNG